MSGVQKPITFQSLPRELRDHIYRETLFDEQDVYSECLAEQNHGTWNSVRRTSPGFYRPVLHVHKTNGSSWQHQTVVAETPALFRIGGSIAREAMELYFKSHVLLEMIVHDSGTAIERWEEEIDAAQLKMIQKLHVLVHAHGVLDSKAKLSQELSYIRYDQLEIGGPVFRIEIRRQGAQLAVLARVQLKELHRRNIAASVEAWAMRRHSSPRGDMPWTGEDAIAVAKLLPKVASSVAWYEFRLDIREDEVERVVNFVRDGRSRSELQLVDTWSETIVIVDATPPFASIEDEDSCVRLPII